MAALLSHAAASGTLRERCTAALYMSSVPNLHRFPPPRLPGLCYRYSVLAGSLHAFLCKISLPRGPQLQPLCGVPDDWRIPPRARLLSFSVLKQHCLAFFSFSGTVVGTNLNLWNTWQAEGPLPRESGSSFCSFESGPWFAIVKAAHCTTSKVGFLDQRTDAHLISQRN